MNHTSQLDFCNWRQKAVRRDNVISIMLRQVYYVDFLNQIRYQPIDLTSLGEPRSISIPHLK